jgi:hypothetical protein
VNTASPAAWYGCVVTVIVSLYVGSGSPAGTELAHLLLLFDCSAKSDVPATAATPTPDPRSRRVDLTEAGNQQTGEERRSGAQVGRRSASICARTCA